VLALVEVERKVSFSVLSKSMGLVPMHYDARALAIEVREIKN
jgi:hypothetical protein